MKVCIYCTSGEDFNTFGYEIIEEFNFKNYVVKVIEFKSLNDLIEFSNKINSELIITNSNNVISFNKENECYSLDFINNFIIKSFKISSTCTIKTNFHFNLSFLFVLFIYISLLLLYDIWLVFAIVF